MKTCDFIKYHKLHQISGGLGYHQINLIGEWEVRVFTINKDEYSERFEISADMNYMKPPAPEDIQVTKNADGTFNVSATIADYGAVAGGVFFVDLRIMDENGDEVINKRWINPTEPDFIYPNVPAEYEGYLARFESRERGSFWPQYDYGTCSMKLGGSNRVVKSFKIEP